MKKRHRTLLLGYIAIALNGCSWVDEHMPVIGERCEHWQCFTASGQQASDDNKKMDAYVANLNGRTAPAPTPNAVNPGAENTPTALPPNAAAPTPQPAPVLPQDYGPLPPEY